MRVAMPENASFSASEESADSSCSRFSRPTCLCRGYVIYGAQEPMFDVANHAVDGHPIELLRFLWVGLLDDLHLERAETLFASEFSNDPTVVPAS